MDNLVKLSSAWLREEDCLYGAIQDRTKAVIDKFNQFIKTNKDVQESLIGASSDEMTKILNICRTDIGNILNASLRGVQYIALKSTKTLVEKMGTETIPAGLRLYKARKGDRLSVFCRGNVPYPL